MLSVPEQQQEARLQSILQSCLNFDISFNKTRKIQDLLKSLLNTDVNIRKDLSRKVSINIVAPIDKVYEVFLKAPIEKQNKENTRKMIMLLAIGKFARLIIIIIKLALRRQYHFRLAQNFHFHLLVYM